MNRIDKTFGELKKRGEKALVGFVTAGDPSQERSLEIVTAMAGAGLDILELGVPFSDPTADGPVIQRASTRSLKGGMTLAGVLEMTSQLRKVSEIPVVVFSYYNPLLAYGLERFYADALAAGVDGVLVVDLPPEESDEMTRFWSGDNLHLIRLIAPMTPSRRMAEISSSAGGFIYMITRTGVTGGGVLDESNVAENIDKIREESSLPVCLGFGISTPEQAKTLASLADGVVVGSAFETIIEAGGADLPGSVAGKVSELKAAI